MMTEETTAVPTTGSTAAGDAQPRTLDDSTRLYYLEAMGIQCWQSLQPAQAAIEETVYGDVSAGTHAPAVTADSSEPHAAAQAIHQVDGAVADWAGLETGIHHCASCQLHATRKQALVGRGNRSADLMFLLLAPEDIDDESEQICSGEAGALFSKMLAAIDIDIDDVYITSLIKCRPPQNHTISPREIMSCREHLKRQLDLIKPTHIVVLGETAIQCLLQKSQTIDRLRADINSSPADATSINPLASIPLFASYSPHELLQKADLKRHAWTDLQQLQKLIHQG